MASQGKTAVAAKGTKKAPAELTAEKLQEIYYKMSLARLAQERIWLIHRAGKIPYCISGDGQEAAQVGSVYALRVREDYFLPYYRDIAAVLALGMTVKELMLTQFAKAEDPNSRGRNIATSWSYRRLNIFTHGSPVATQILHAAGVAYAAKMRKEDKVTIVYFGDGAASEGDFHEGLNFAGIHKLPVIFFCENNGYAISVPLRKQSAIENIGEKGPSYGMPGVVIDGVDVLKVYEVTKTAADRARNGEGPTLIEAKVPRFHAHSSDDDDTTYRDPKELEEMKKKDPVTQFRAYLEKKGLWDTTREEEMMKAIDREVEEAIDYAEKAPFLPVEELYSWVYYSER